MSLGQFNLTKQESCAAIQQLPSLLRWHNSSCMSTDRQLGPRTYREDSSIAIEQRANTSFIPSNLQRHTHSAVQNSMGLTAADAVLTARHFSAMTPLADPLERARFPPLVHPLAAPRRSFTSAITAGAKERLERMKCRHEDLCTHLSGQDMC